MKRIFLLLIITYSLATSAQIPYTLENLKKLNLYYADRSGLFSKKEQEEIKESIKDKLTKNGFVLNAVDPSTLLIKIKTIDIDDTIVANITLLVAEEVTTKREEEIETMALSFHINSFVELDEPTIEIKESINSMLGEFIKLYNEDME